MANPLLHATDTLERVHNTVQPYMADLFYRLANNYMLLLVLVLIVNMFGIPLLAQFTPLLPSTVNILGFSAMLLILVFGWRFLENRNHATTLFVIYVRYSSQKRTLQNTITLAENGVLEDENTLYVHVDLLEETANNLLEAAKTEGLKAREA